MAVAWRLLMMSGLAARAACVSIHNQGLSLLQISATATSPPTVQEENYDEANSPTKMNVNDVTNINEEQQADIFMRYWQEHNVVICSCAKCGSTSLYEYAYELEFHKKWEFGDTWPYAQETDSERWQGKVIQVNSTSKQKKIMENGFSFALIRDPKERLISAWKSKLACDESYGVDVHDRSSYVHDPQHHAWPRGFVFGFQRLYGAEENITCLSLPMFVDGLVKIKDLGRRSWLDRHFLPQDEGCFYRYPANKWSVVTTIDQQSAFDKLAEHMGGTPKPMLDIHRSQKTVYVSKDISDKLDYITKDEYAMLAPYLPHGYSSPVVAGESVFETGEPGPLLASS